MAESTVVEEEIFSSTKDGLVSPGKGTEKGVLIGEENKESFPEDEDEPISWWHGMRDCVDALIDSKKLRYGIWLRASPWRSVKDFDQEVNREMGSTSTIAKKLFVTKDRDVKEKQGAEAVNDVASLLNKVSFEEPVEGQLGLGEVQERGMMSKGGEEAQVVQQSSPGITTEMERSNIQVADAFVFGGIESLHTPGRS
ncbi:unnamed protein product [Amaranthus hypochondriacus]